MKSNLFRWFAAAVLILSATAAAHGNVKGGITVSARQVTAVPEQYRRAVSAELRGRILDVEYEVKNYIDPSRMLVSDRPIERAEAGREVGLGEPILKKCNVYLPPGYDAEDIERKYNVLYLLHGVGGNRFEWLYGSGRVDGNFVIANIFDNLIANGEVEPLIVVFPEGRSAHDWESTAFTAQNTNLLGFYYFDYELRYDLIPFIEANYNTYANIAETSPEAVQYNRKHRAIAGLSMGGMQALNLILGGYRFDHADYVERAQRLPNGLAQTVPAPGMHDLFAYVGAFSNAPTSTAGIVLGKSIGLSPHEIDLLYLTCGDADGIAIRSYKDSIEGLRAGADDRLRAFYQVVIRGASHDFGVWNHGAYNFVRLCFGRSYEQNTVVLTLDK